MLQEYQFHQWVSWNQILSADDARPPQILQEPAVDILNQKMRIQLWIILAISWFDWNVEDLTNRIKALQRVDYFLE